MKDAQKSTGFKDRYGVEIYEGDHLYNCHGESFFVTRSYIDDNGDLVTEDEPLLFDCCGDGGLLKNAPLIMLAKNFNRIYNDPIFKG